MTFFSNLRLRIKIRKDADLDAPIQRKQSAAVVPAASTPSRASVIKPPEDIMAAACSSKSDASPARLYRFPAELLEDIRLIDTGEPESDSDELDDCPSPHVPPKRLHSLPDELLDEIIGHVAGEAHLTQALLGWTYKRSEEAVVDLRSLRLVDRRISRVTEVVAYRTPNTATFQQEPLTSADAEILLPPVVIPSTRQFAVAGPPEFLAIALETRVQSVTALALNFTSHITLPYFPDEDREADTEQSTAHTEQDPNHTDWSKAHPEQREVLLSSLFNMVPSFNLTELHISIHQSVYISIKAFFQSLGTAAGQPTLRSLSIVRGRKQFWDHEPLRGQDLDPGSRSCSIRSLMVGGLTREDALRLRAALGRLPQVSELEIQSGILNIPTESPCSGMAEALLSGISNQIRTLKLSGNQPFGNNDVFTGLADLGNLSTLTFAYNVNSVSGIFDILAKPLPKLAHISLLQHDAFASAANIFSWALDQHKTRPRFALESISIRVVNGCPLDIVEMSRARAMRESYNKLVEANPRLRITPDYLKKWMRIYIQDEDE